MNQRTARRRASILIATLAAVVVVASIAAVAVLGRAVPSSEPSSAPVVTPAPIVSPAPVVPAPTPVGTPVPTPEPTETSVDAMPITVGLETLTPHHVYIDIVDDSFSVVKAVSGTPTASTPVEPYTLKVENIDDRTLRLTWVDRPGDNALALYIDRAANRFVLVQPEHDLAGDTMLHDRVLILTFRDAIDADSIETFLQDGLDTPA